MRQVIGRVFPLALVFFVGAFCWAQDAKEPARTNRFFAAPSISAQVDFWGIGPRPAKKESEGVSKFTEVVVGEDGTLTTYTPPRAVLDLLEAPTETNAQAYLAWQRERLQALSKALEAIKKASAHAEPKQPSEEAQPNRPYPSIRLAYFKRAYCPACALQDPEIARASGKLGKVSTTDSSTVASALGIESFPTLVLTNMSNGKTVRLVGLKSESQILKAAADLERNTDEKP